MKVKNENSVNKNQIQRFVSWPKLFRQMAKQMFSTFNFIHGESCLILKVSLKYHKLKYYTSTLGAKVWSLGVSSSFFKWYHFLYISAREHFSDHNSTPIVIKLYPQCLSRSGKKTI